MSGNPKNKFHQPLWESQINAQQEYKKALPPKNCVLVPQAPTPSWAPLEQGSANEQPGCCSSISHLSVPQQQKLEIKEPTGKAQPFRQITHLFIHSFNLIKSLLNA